MKNILSICLFALILSVQPVFAAMEPSLGVVMPLAQEGESVILERAIIVNKTDILPAGSVLRTCFQPPPPDGKEVRQKESKDRLERTFSRKPIEVSSKDDEMTAYKAALKDMAFLTTWSNPDLFRGYFHKVAHDRYYLVYQKPGASEPGFSKFFFPEGLFLAAGDDSLDVLAVEKDSRGEEAGFRAGDRIHQFNGQETGADLASFLPRYIQASKAAPGGSRFLVFQVTNDQSSEPFERKIALPMSINADPFAPILE